MDDRDRPRSLLEACAELGQACRVLVAELDRVFGITWLLDRLSAWLERKPPAD